MINVTITCNPAGAPAENIPEHLSVYVGQGSDYWSAWRLISDMQLPARLFLTANITLEGVPLPGPPSVVAMHQVIVTSAPELVAAGKVTALDFAYNYEAILVSRTGHVSIIHRQSGADSPSFANFRI